MNKHISQGPHITLMMCDAGHSIEHVPINSKSVANYSTSRAKLSIFQIVGVPKDQIHLHIYSEGKLNSLRNFSKIIC